MSWEEAHFVPVTYTAVFLPFGRVSRNERDCRENQPTPRSLRTAGVTIDRPRQRRTAQPREDSATFGGTACSLTRPAFARAEAGRHISAASRGGATATPGASGYSTFAPPCVKNNTCAFPIRYKCTPEDTLRVAWLKHVFGRWPGLSERSGQGCPAQCRTSKRLLHDVSAASTVAGRPGMRSKSLSNVRSRPPESRAAAAIQMSFTGSGVPARRRAANRRP